ncbi:MAG TPA: hypothetical protein P5560_11545 [Thermotogota bacterium]|nr:hypothetical protein [Thermotogota bacterium]HRW93574.1 hypothetical protein [Thermotogota bacterium]
MPDRNELQKKLKEYKDGNPFRSEDFEALLIGFARLWEGQKQDWDGNNLAYLLRKAKRFKEAEEICIQVEEQNPGFAPIHTQHAWALFGLHFTDLDRERLSEANYPQLKQLFQRIRDMDVPGRYSPEKNIFQNVLKGLWSIPSRPIGRVLDWLSLFDPMELPHEVSVFQVNGKHRESPSPRESWYSHMSKSLQAREAWEECRKSCEQALENIPQFSGNNPDGFFFRYRRAQCFAAMGQHDKAVPLFRGLLEKKGEWYIFRDIALSLRAMAEEKQAFENAVQGMLRFQPFAKLENAWKLLFLLADFYRDDKQVELSHKHLELCALLHRKAGWEIKPELESALEEAGIDADSLDPATLGRRYNELKDAWQQKALDSLASKPGTVLKLLPKGGGFLRSEDGKEFHFSASASKSAKPPLSEGEQVVFHYDAKQVVERGKKASAVKVTRAK